MPPSRFCSAIQPAGSTSSERYASSSAPAGKANRLRNFSSTACASPGGNTSRAAPTTKVNATARELPTQNSWSVARGLWSAISPQNPRATDREPRATIKIRARMDRFKRFVPFFKPLLLLALFAVALRILAGTLAQYRYHDVINYLSSLPIDQIILAVALTLLGYLVMTFYDTLAFRYIRHPLPYFKIALASFVGYAFNNNVGLSGLVGGSLRYRLYNAWRLEAVQIAKVIAFCTISFWLGFVILGGTFFIIAPPELPAE